MIDLTGQIFERLTVLRKLNQQEKEERGYKSRDTFWECRCSCGKFSYTDSWRLRNGHSKSCGCYAQERRHKANFKHGLTKNPLYNRFLAIKSRCTNPHTQSYPRYGGRGITICEEWLNDPKKFIDYMERICPDIYSVLELGYEIDRTDNNGNYEPGNVRLINKIDNANNRATNVHLEAFGGVYTKAQLLRLCGNKVSKSTFGNRLYTGWHPEKAAMVIPQRGSRLPQDFDKPYPIEDREFILSMAQPIT